MPDESIVRAKAREVVRQGKLPTRRPDGWRCTPAAASSSSRRPPRPSASRGCPRRRPRNRLISATGDTCEASCSEIGTLGSSGRSWSIEDPPVSTRLMVASHPAERSSRRPRGEQPNRRSERSFEPDLSPQPLGECREHARRDPKFRRAEGGGEVVGPFGLERLRCRVPLDSLLRQRVERCASVIGVGTGFEQPRGDSGKLDQVRQHRRVGLTYARPTDNTYVSLSGTAQVVIDRAKAEELWDPSYQAWFPGGPSDPDLAMIKVTVELAEYWAAPALTWPLSAGFVVMAPDHRDDPRFHARIVLDPRDRSAPSDPQSLDGLGVSRPFGQHVQQLVARARARRQAFWRHSDGADSPVSSRVQCHLRGRSSGVFHLGSASCVDSAKH